jgi:hypothetical protein
MATNRALSEPEGKAGATRGLSPDEIDRLTALGWDVWNRQGEGQTTGSLGRVWSFSILHEPYPRLRITADDTFQDVRQDTLAVVSPDPIQAAIISLDTTTGSLAAPR